MNMRLQYIIFFLFQGYPPIFLQVRKNNAIYIDKAIDEQLGFVGDPKKIDTKILNNFFKQKIIPVIAPMGIEPMSI